MPRLDLRTTILVKLIFCISVASISLFHPKAWFCFYDLTQAVFAVMVTLGLLGAFQRYKHLYEYRRDILSLYKLFFIGFLSCEVLVCIRSWMSGTVYWHHYGENYDTYVNEVIKSNEVYHNIYCLLAVGIIIPIFVHLACRITPENK